MSFVDSSGFARDFLTDGDRCSLRSFVRPLYAVHMTAGLDEIRVPGPNQTNELASPGTTSGCPGCGPFRSSSFTSALASHRGDFRRSYLLLRSDCRYGFAVFSLRQQRPGCTRGLVCDGGAVDLLHKRRTRFQSGRSGLSSAVEQAFDI